HLFTTVPDTAFDADDTVGGVKKTLKQALKAPFNLMAPASAFVSADGKTTSAVISPLTTLVSHDMISGNGKSLDDAEKAVRTRMNLPDDTDLKQDFVKKGDAPLIKLAQVVATAIGEVKKAAKDDNGTSDRDALFAALSYLKQNATVLQDALSGTGTVSDQVKTALLIDALKPDAKVLIEDAKKVTASGAYDIANILAEGFYDGDCLLEANCGGTPDYFKTSGANGKWQGQDYTLSNGQWSKNAAVSSSSNFSLTVNGWVANGSGGDSGTFTSDGQGGGTATETNTGKKFRLSTRMVDLSGKTASSIPNLLPAAATDLTFAPGSKLFWIQTSLLDDEYRLHTGYPLEVWSCTVSACASTPLTSLDQFISAYATDKASSSKLYQQWSNLVFTFDAGGTATGGSVTLWGPAGCNYNNNSCSKAGSALYEIRTVSGQQVLIIKAQAPENRRGEYLMFAAKDGALHGGSYRPAGTDESNDPSFNKAAINSIMSAGNKPQVVD
ncbi:MAG: hypothetical protein ABIO19_05840, partial [Burkholderiaceae bacterium]